MKEYWVNVYEGKYLSDMLRLIGNKWKSAELSKNHINAGNRKLNCRLHVREFDTREAKELYLKLKYGNSGPVVPFYIVQVMNMVLK